MRFTNLWVCKNCAALALQPYLQPAVSQNINQIVCAGCKGVFVRHHCSHNYPASDPLWLKYLEAGVPSLCPLCGPVYSIAKQVATSPRFSPDMMNIAALICVGLLAGVLGKVIQEAISS
jgi:hypothetical protein